MEPTAKELLGPRPLMREIAAQVCAEHGLTLRFLIGSSRQRRVAWPRQDAFRMCYEAGHTMEEIGRFFDRDHTTVLYGIRCARKRCEFSPTFSKIALTENARLAPPASNQRVAW